MEINKKIKRNNKSVQGFSLIEMLIVLFVFAILAIVATQTLTLSLRGSKKSESVSKNRENIQYAVNVMDRLLRNARDITCATPSPATSNRVDYIDEYGNAAYFSCQTVGTDTFIASNSATARLTSNTVRITNCSAVFSCTNGVGVPDSVDIRVIGQDANVVGAEGSTVDISTKILLRNY